MACTTRAPAKIRGWFSTPYFARVEEALNLMGPKCNSWGLPARGTSSRTYINIFGAMQWDFVREGTMMISRTL